MHKLEQLQQRIKGLNKAGIKRLEGRQYELALKCFNQCEGILEYAASCGRSIDRELIIAVLNNEACVFQKTNELQKFMDYVQAILFNISTYLQTSQVEQLIKGCLDDDINAGQFNENYMQRIKPIIMRKYEYSQYLLLYAEQQKIRNRFRQAIDTANKSKKEMMEAMELAYNYLVLSESLGLNSKVELLRELKEQPREISHTEYNRWVQKFNNLIISNAEGRFTCKFASIYEHFSHEQKEYLAFYSYENVLEISPKNIEEQKTSQFLFDPFQNLVRVLQLSGCLYFLCLAIKELIKQEAPSTNLYLFDSIEIKQVQTKRNIKVANIYEFYSITMLMQFLGCQNQMLNEIVQEYNKNQERIQEQLNEKELRDKEKENQVEELSKKYLSYLIEPQQQKDYQMSVESSLSFKENNGQNQQEGLKNSNKLIQFLTPYMNSKNNNEFLFQFPSIQSIQMENSSSQLAKNASKLIPEVIPQEHQEDYPYFTIQQVKSNNKMNYSKQISVPKLEEKQPSKLPQIKEHISKKDKLVFTKFKKGELHQKDKNNSTDRNTSNNIKKNYQFMTSTKNSSSRSIKKLQNSKSVKFNVLQSTAKNKLSINIYKSKKIPSNAAISSSLKQCATFNSIKMNKVKSPPRNVPIINHFKIIKGKNNSGMKKSNEKSKTNSKSKSKSKSQSKAKLNNKKLINEEKIRQIPYYKRK